MAGIDASGSASRRVLTNARLVLANEVLRGTIVLQGGRIAAIDHGLSRVPGAIDLAGDLVIAGLIDLHTALGCRVGPGIGGDQPRHPDRGLGHHHGI
jgi:alpha-D-ribose 1-methylphosphonate 5-triphosphate diphosphatase PhnM